MKAFHMLRFAFVVMLLNMTFGCVSYDFKPVLLKGTTFHADNQNCDCSSKYASRLIITHAEIRSGTFLKQVKTYVPEYIFLAFYAGRLLGTYNNGDIENLVSKELENLEMKETDFILVEVSEIEFKSNNLFDFLNDFLPGGFFRYQRFSLTYNLKILSKEDVDRLKISN